MADHSSDSDENKTTETSSTAQTTSNDMVPVQDSEMIGPDFDRNKTPVVEDSSSNSNNYSFVPRTGNILSPPRLAANPFAVKTSTPTRSVADSTENKELVTDGRPVLTPAIFTPHRISGDSGPTPDTNRSKFSLRPSSLEAQTAKLHSSRSSSETVNPSSSFKLKPAVLSNPFVSCDSIIEKQTKQEVTTSKIGETSTNFSVKEVANENKLPLTSSLPSSSPSSLSCVRRQATSELEQDNISSTVASGNDNFVAPENPLTAIQNSSAFNCVSQGTTASSTDFVFGQNMNERVRNVNTIQNEVANSNGIGNLTFTPNTSNSENDTSQENYSNGDSVKSKSLHESAQEYESRKVKRTYEEVTVVTGEEEESNVLQMNCKLFAFDKVASTWIERGRGLLRLNDKEEMQEGTLQSRLVMRTQGSLRVVLNTKIWSGMAVDKPNSKSVRITAMDKDSIKIFLVVASPKDAEQLHNALICRVTTLKATEEQTCENHSGEVQSCQPSTTSEESAASPKRRRLSPDNFDDSSSSEYSANIQDMSIDSTSRNKPATIAEADGGNSSSSSTSSL